MIIAIDFDGTVVTHEFPKVGQDIGAEPVLRRILDNGHQLILWTMRIDKQPAFWTREVDPANPEIVKIAGKFLSDAVQWFFDRNIPLYGIQENPTQKNWTESRKAYAQLYIDDAALGCPLKFDKDICDRPFVDWPLVELMLENAGILLMKTEEKFL